METLLPGNQVRTETRRRNPVRQLRLPSASRTLSAAAALTSFRLRDSGRWTRNIPLSSFSTLLTLELSRISTPFDQEPHRNAQARGITAADIAEHLLLKARVSGGIHSLDRGPDKSRGSFFISIAELCLQQRFPDLFKCFAARELYEPILDRDLFELFPILDPGRVQRSSHQDAIC